jgi:hypothetical protein
LKLLSSPSALWLSFRIMIASMKYGNAGSKEEIDLLA